MIDSSIILVAAFFLFAAISVGVILILWIAMPFSVFGVKSLLKKALDEQAETNRLLRALLERQGPLGANGSHGAGGGKETASGSPGTGVSTD